MSNGERRKTKVERRPMVWKARRTQRREARLHGHPHSVKGAKLARRRFLHLAASAAVLPASHIAWAQAYPTRPVRIIVGFAAGGSTDILARLIGQWLSERLGRQFIIENRPGAGTTIATDALVRARADGYTLGMVSGLNGASATLFSKVNYDFIRDIAPVACIVNVPFVMAVNPAVPAKTVAEFIEYAKANPGKISHGSGGIGSGSHLAGELFKFMTGINMVHVPYRGNSPALTDLLGGQTQVGFDSMPSLTEYIRSGNLRALAITTATRSEALPDVPSMSEFVPGYEASALFGIGAPKNTPSEVIDKLNKEINAGLANSNIRARLADLGGTPVVVSPTGFGKLIAEEIERWGKVIRAANIKPE